MKIINLKSAVVVASVLAGGTIFMSSTHALPTKSSDVAASKAADTGGSDISKATANYRAMQVGFQSGVKSEADMDRAAITLAEAHLHFDAPNTPNETLSNLNLIASQRAELFRIATTKYHAGAVNFAEVKQASAALMEANARVSLYKAVTYQDGTDLKQAVDAAAIVLRNAQDLKGDSQPSVNSHDPK